ncbi:hypothetical protein [Dongia sedimenti]|uniref:Uncharacterized protein n=1 Tax=Dongia sedimenti TaxID=3064282 RepID=A0ABU0YV80_9PROT|nr:hypothetical protein [Rhodospirillaceae bacterium R-7]
MNKLKPLIDRCRPHSYVAAAVESLFENLRAEKKAAGNDETAKRLAHMNAVSVYKQAMQAVPNDEADALLKAVLVLQFSQLRAEERERKLYQTWINEIIAVGSKAPMLHGSTGKMA